MSLLRFDINLLIFLDVLLEECNVSKAAARLNITQPAMSNRLNKIRKLLNDPVLVRTSKGMQPTKKLLQLQPVVKEIIQTIGRTLVVNEKFDCTCSDRVFRIMASDYTASTLLPPLLDELAKQAPKVSLDIITPSDTTFAEIKNGQVDFAINSFTHEPLSLHQQVLWEDKFCLVMRTDNLKKKKLTLDEYFNSKHVWVNKTDCGIGVGEDFQQLSAVDSAISRLGKQRNIKLFTQSYHVALQLAQEQNLIATVPYRAALLKKTQYRFEYFTCAV